MLSGYQGSLELEIACLVLEYGERGVYLAQLARRLKDQTSTPTVSKYLKKLAKGGMLIKASRARTISGRLRWVDVYRVSDENKDYLTACKELMESGKNNLILSGSI